MGEQKHSDNQYSKTIQRTTKLLKQAIQNGQIKEYKMTDAEMKELWENDDEWQSLQTKNGMLNRIPFFINCKNKSIKHCFYQTTTTVTIITKTGKILLHPTYFLYHLYYLSQLENLVRFSNSVGFL